jgi:pre-mRNA cleavage complex 2 protein Pcf11
MQEAAAAAPKLCTVPVDDSQTHCALSGERFQQFWDEQHQEWRYRDAMRLDADEATRLALGAST